MKMVTPEIISELLNTAVVNQLCVRYWLGNADILFLGFGDHVLAPPEYIQMPGVRPFFHHPESAPYELQTDLSDWEIAEGSTLLGSSYDDPRAETAASMLVGRKAKSWRFLQPGWGLQIEFEDNLTLKVKAYEPLSKDAVWSLWDPNGFIFVIRSNGEIYTQRSSEPSNK